MKHLTSPTLALALMATTLTAKDADMTPHMITGPAGQIATYAYGAQSDLTIVMIHGDLARASQWGAVAESLSIANHVLAYDGRGQGNTDAATDYSFAARAADLDAVITTLGAQNILLVAHSGGVGVALEYATTHADILKGIFLLDPATDPRAMPDEVRNGYLGALAGEGAVQVVQGYYASIAGENGETIAQIQADAAAADASAIIGIPTTLAHWDPTLTLDALTTPITTLMTPTGDNPAALYHLHSAMTHGVIDSAGHWVQMDVPDQVADAIRGFMLGLND